MLIRRPAVAGAFYPIDPETLKRDVHRYLNEAKDFKLGADRKIKAIIAPHAGYMYSGIVAGAVYKLLKGSNFKRVILIGPSHHIGFNYVALTEYEKWETPLGEIGIDQDANQSLSKSRHFRFLEEAHTKEHSLEVQVPFLQTMFKKFELIPLATGQDTKYTKIAKELNSILDEHTLIVVSTDLSHYFSQAQANNLDKSSIDFVLSQSSRDIKNEAEACGLEGILILNEIANMNKWKVELIDYRTSGDITGDHLKVVGYASFVYY